MSLDESDDLLVNTSFTNESTLSVSSARKALIQGWAFLLPALFFLASYIYLLYGLMKNKIWKQKPFYLSFVGLGISDCLFLSYRVVACVQRITQSDITNDSPSVAKILSLLIGFIYYGSFNLSCQLMGVISLLRAIAVFSPIFFKETVHQYSGVLAIVVGVVTSLGPFILAHCTVVSYWHVNVITKEFVLLIQSPLPQSMIATMFIYVIYPAVMSGMLPVCMYAAIAAKLRFCSTNANDKQVELKFLFIGSTLAAVSLIVMVCFLFPFLHTIVNGEMTVFPTLETIGNITEMVMFGMNPYVYWVVDPTIKKMVTPPWRLHRKTQVEPNGTIGPNGSSTTKPAQLQIQTISIPTFKFQNETTNI